MPRTYQLHRSATEHSSTCHCIRLLHNLLNVLVQIANKLALQKNIRLLILLLVDGNFYPELPFLQDTKLVGDFQVF
jgi:hypothetical protein